MARIPKDYWERRSTQLMQRLERGTEKTIDSLIKAYEQATKNINKEISNIFKNYTKDDVLTKEQYKQLLTRKETDTYYKNLLEVINNNITDETIKKKLLAKYNAPAYSYRISRYEALQQNIDVELKKLANIEQDITKVRYVDTINEAYYHTIYDIQKGTGLSFSFAQIDNKTINMLLNEKWIDKQNFSQRIWGNSEKLGNYLQTQLTADTTSGKSIQRISSELASFMNVGLFNATRLIRTEVNHFANEGEMLSYEELDIEKYRFIATLDKRTCMHCAKLDNQVFSVKDRKPGKNFPPLHPLDRCSTVAEFDDDVTEGLQRRARDEDGKSILVSQDMSYNEWKEKYVNNVSTKQEKDGTINVEDSIVVKKLKTTNIEYNIAQKLKKELTSDEIIQKISGGDKTKGSCSSVAFAYIGNKSGLDVIDFRGGESQDFFSTASNIYDISQLSGIKSIVEENSNDIMAAMKLLKQVEEGKEYYLSTGQHAAIVRREKGKLQYLELQEEKDNGFKQFTTQTLKKRFNCKQSNTRYGYKLKPKNFLMEVDSFKDNKEFEKVLGYINTQKSKQIKGAGGHAK